MNVEYLQTIFRSSYAEMVPTVIIIEDIHEFATAKKQLLLYTLLDLIHRSDALFVLVSLLYILY